MSKKFQVVNERIAILSKEFNSMGSTTYFYETFNFASGLYTLAVRHYNHGSAFLQSEAIDCMSKQGKELARNARAAILEQYPQAKIPEIKIT